MPLSDIILSGKEALVSASESLYGVRPIDGSTMFGTVQLVSDLTDRLTVNQSVMFNPKDGRRIMYGSTVYYLLSEDKISGTEVTPP